MLIILPILVIVVIVLVLVGLIFFNLSLYKRNRLQSVQQKQSVPQKQDIQRKRKKSFTTQLHDMIFK